MDVQDQAVVKVSASASTKNMPRNAIDGDITTAWIAGNDGVQAWTALPHWIELEWPRTYSHLVWSAGRVHFRVFL